MMDAAIQTSVETLDLVDRQTQTGHGAPTPGFSEPPEACNDVCDRATATSPPLDSGIPIPQQLGASAAKNKNIAAATATTTTSQNTNNKFYELEHGLIGHVIIHKYVTTTITTTTTTEKGVQGVQGGRLRVRGISERDRDSARPPLTPPGSTFETSTTYVEFNTGTGPQSRPKLVQEASDTISWRVVQDKKAEDKEEGLNLKDIDIGGVKEVPVPDRREEEDEAEASVFKSMITATATEEENANVNVILLEETEEEEEDKDKDDQDQAAEAERESFIEKGIRDMEDQIFGKLMAKVDEEPHIIPQDVHADEEEEGVEGEDDHEGSNTLEGEEHEGEAKGEEFLAQDEVVTKNVTYDMTVPGTATAEIPKSRPRRQSTPHHITATATITKSVSSQTDEASFIRSSCSSASASRRRPRVGHSHSHSTANLASTSTHTSTRVCSTHRQNQEIGQGNGRLDSGSGSGHTIDIKLEIEKVNLHMRIGRTASTSTTVICDNGKRRQAH